MRARAHRTRREHVETFATTVPSLLGLADWLEAHSVTQVAMEATGVYWKPIWAILEDRFTCILVTAATSSRWRWFSTASPLGWCSRTVQPGCV